MVGVLGVDGAAHPPALLQCNIGVLLWARNPGGWDATLR
jgi:hypothetical protein